MRTKLLRTGQYLDYLDNFFTYGFVVNTYSKVKVDGQEYTVANKAIIDMLLNLTNDYTIQETTLEIHNLTARGLDGNEVLERLAVGYVNAVLNATNIQGGKQ